MSGNHEVFPVSRASYLDGWRQRLKYQPSWLVGRYVCPGDTVLDIGCGTSLFTLPIARRVGENGQVIAVDLQEGMLEILQEKAMQQGLITRIRFHKAEPHSLALNTPGRIDVAWGLCVVHEVPDVGRLMQEVFSLLAPSGRFIIAEPKHEVPAGEFEETLAAAALAGFRRIGTPFVLWSWTALFRKEGVPPSISVTMSRSEDAVLPPYAVERTSNGEPGFFTFPGPGANRRSCAFHQR